MGNFFNLDAPIWAWISEITDVIILSCLWWLCCIPIVTIGASTTAFFYVMGKKIRKENHYILKDFFKSFKENFKQSLLPAILMIVANFSMILYILMSIEGLRVGNVHLKWLLPMTIIFIFEFINIFTYLWAILSRFNMKTKQLLKAAILMPHKHLFTTLGNTCAFIISGLLIYHIPFLIVFVPGIVITLSSVLMQSLFERYIIGETVQNS